MTERSKVIPIALAGTLAIFVAVSRLVPLEYRSWNMAAIGALALFAGARIGLWQSLAISFGALLISDVILLVQYDFNQQYLPFASVYAAYALYAVLGYALLRNSNNPLRIGGTAVVGSVLFFVVTNFVSWLSPVHGYEMSFRGLLTCYEAAVPFFRGTLIGDLFYTVLLFGAAYALTPALVPERITVKS